MRLRLRMATSPSSPTSPQGLSTLERKACFGFDSYMVPDLTHAACLPGILLENDLFDTCMKTIPGATFNSTSLLLEIPPSSIPFMKPLKFVFSDRVFTLNVAPPLIPQWQNTQWGGVEGKQYGTVSNFGTTESLDGPGCMFVLGMLFMERYYTVGGGLSIGEA